MSPFRMSAPQDMCPAPIKECLFGYCYIIILEQLDIQ